MAEAAKKLSEQDAPLTHIHPPTFTEWPALDTLDVADGNAVALAFHQAKAQQKELNDYVKTLDAALIDLYGEQPDQSKTKHIDLPDAEVTLTFRESPVLDQDLVRKAMRKLTSEKRRELFKGSIAPRNAGELKKYLDQAAANPEEEEAKTLIDDALSFKSSKPTVAVDLKSEESL